MTFGNGDGTGGKLRPYGLSVPAVALAVWLGLLIARAGVAQLSLTPLQLVIALTAWYGGLGPGVFALLESVIAIDFFFIDPGTLFRFAGGAQAAFSLFIAGWLTFCWLAGGV